MATAEANRIEWRAPQAWPVTLRGDPLQYDRGMEHYRRTAHTRFDIKFHLVWITKYRKKLLRGDVGLRLRQIVRTICAELEVEILKGHVSQDHVHLFVSCPPHVSASYLMQRVKGKSSRILLREYSHLNKACWGRHLWARGFFVASSGNVTDEVIMEYIRNAGGDEGRRRFQGGRRLNRQSTVGLSADWRTHRLPAGGGSVLLSQHDLKDRSSEACRTKTSAVRRTIRDRRVSGFTTSSIRFSVPSQSSELPFG